MTETTGAPSTILAESPIESSPRLRNIFDAYSILGAPRGPEDTDPLRANSWDQLDREVGEFGSMLELSDKVHNVTEQWVKEKIPEIQKLPAFQGFDAEGLKKAISSGWFEEVRKDGNEVKGFDAQRRKILLSVISHRARRIETSTYKNILKRADDQTLTKIGLDRSLADLTIDLLGAAEKNDFAYIRHAAMTQLNDQDPYAVTTLAKHTGIDDPLQLEEISKDAIRLKRSHGEVSFREAYPMTMHDISKKLAKVVGEEGSVPAWVNRPGGEAYKAYLQTLSAYYDTKDIPQAAQLRVEADAKLKEAAAAGFPVLLISGISGYEKEPYVDPELKIAINTPAEQEDEEKWRRMGDALADDLGTMGLERFAPHVTSEVVKNTVLIGAHGVNLASNGVAQEEPIFLNFRNEQARAYDSEIMRYLSTYIAGSDSVFTDQNTAIEISKALTPLHEYAHGIYDSKSPEYIRLRKMNPKEATTIDEAKAEIMFRPFIPSLIAKGVIPGNEAQWAQALTANAIQYVYEQPSDDPYYQMGVMCLNDLFATHVLQYNGDDKKVHVSLEKDENTGNLKYFDTLRKTAEKMIELHEHSPKDIAEWVKTETKPSEELQKVINLVKNKNDGQTAAA